ncbi:metal-sensing transcriptional repressor [bacterium BFN5]|nr:metal-sensing transcriptional repressor [bacterium BFN5]
MITGRSISLLARQGKYLLLHLDNGIVIIIHLRSVDILQQILAARAALNKVAQLILESHAKSCLVTAIKEDRAEQSIEELMGVLRQFNK